MFLFKFFGAVVRFINFISSKFVCYFHELHGFIGFFVDSSVIDFILSRCAPLSSSGVNVWMGVTAANDISCTPIFVLGQSGK